MSLSSEHCFRELRLAPVPEGHRKVFGLLLEELETLIATLEAHQAAVAVVTQGADHLSPPTRDPVSCSECNDLHRRLAAEQEKTRALEAATFIETALKCPRCSTAAHQPNDRCDAHVSWKDRLQTEAEMHAAWRKRAEEAESALKQAMDERGKEIDCRVANQDSVRRLSEDRDNWRQWHGEWKARAEATEARLSLLVGRVEAVVREMRVIQMVAGQCSVEVQDNQMASMAAAESDRLRAWADGLDAVLPPSEKEEDKNRSRVASRCTGDVALPQGRTE